MVLDDCMVPLSASQQAFFDQAPRSRYVYLRGLPQPYTRVIGDSLPVDAIDERGLYLNWKKTGRISFKSQGRQFRLHIEEHFVLFKAYKYGLDLGLAGSAFRDALMDAVAEWLDVCGGEYVYYILLCELLSAAERYTPLEKLLAYHLALISEKHEEMIARKEDDRTERFFDCFREEMKTFKTPKGITGQRIWDEFMANGRCRFHEHAGTDFCDHNELPFTSQRDGVIGRAI